MDIDKSIIEQTFDMIENEYGSPVKEGEITASMLYQSDNTVTMRTHLNRLKRLVEQGKMTYRVAKQGELAFKPNDDR